MLDDRLSELKELRQWVCWRWEEASSGNLTKPPYSIKGFKASHSKPDHWCSYSEALEAKESKGFDGIGFVLTESDPFVMVDIDDCLIDGTLQPWAAKVVRKFQSTYSEVSPSGNGLKILCKGVLPGPGRHPHDSDLHVGIFDRQRYVCLTGSPFNKGMKPIVNMQDQIDWLYPLLEGKGKPIEMKEVEPARTAPKTSPKMSDEDIIGIIRYSKQREKFVKLFEGGWEDLYDDDHSAADQALASMLAFYTQDGKQISRILSQSSLGRKKWDERTDYRIRTIKKALKGVREAYQPAPKIESKPTSEYVPLSVPEYLRQRPSNAKIIRLLNRSPLGLIAKVFRTQLVPEMPLELALPQAIALVSAALSRDKMKGLTLADLMGPKAEGHSESDPKTLSSIPLRGKDRLTLFIGSEKAKESANSYLLMIAPSTSGKSVGGIVDDTASNSGIAISNGGSGEGFLDDLAETGNPIILIDEFTPYLTPGRYQHSLTEFLLELFGRGQTKIKYSKGSKVSSRVIDFGFPTILAAIQPEKFQEHCKAGQVNNGFIGRFLVSYLPDLPNTTKNWEPELGWRDAVEYLKPYLGLSGQVVIEQHIREKLDCIVRTAHNHLSERSQKSLRRLIPQYTPRLAAMVSCSLNPSDEDWETALQITFWFLHQTIDAMSLVGQVLDSDSRVMESLRPLLLEKVMQVETSMGRPANYTEIKYSKGLRGYADSKVKLALKMLVDDGSLIQSTYTGKSKSTEGWAISRSKGSKE